MQFTQRDGAPEREQEKKKTMSMMQQAHKMHTRQEDCFWGLKSKQKRTYANMHKIFRRA
jgi:hypothetical protein